MYLVFTKKRQLSLTRGSQFERWPISVDPLFVEKQLSILEIVTTKRTLHFATKSANLAAVTLSMLVIGPWRPDCCIFCRSRYLAIVTSAEFNLLTPVFFFQPGIVLSPKLQVWRKIATGNRDGHKNPFD